MWRKLWHESVGAVLLAIISSVAGVPFQATYVLAQTDGPRLYRANGSYDDVRFELNNAIIARGLNIQTTGNVAEMLDRTGPATGATRKVFKAAEYVTFCSAKLSQQMIEADPANLVFCPFVIVIYETADKPGETIVAYRPPVPTGSGASRAAIAEADKLLEAIARDATK